MSLVYNSVLLIEYCGFMCADHPKAIIVAHRVQRVSDFMCREIEYWYHSTGYLLVQS